jgi:PKD domain
MALVTRLVTIGGVLIVVSLFPGSAEADSNGSCSATGSIAGCLGYMNGTIDVSGELHRRGRSGYESHPVGDKAIDLEATAAAAYCADAAANASNGPAAGPIADIVPLCGFAPAVGRIAPPSPGQVLGAFRELGLYRGAVRSDPERVSFVNLETYFWCGDGGQTCVALGEGERTVTLLGQVVRIRPRIIGYEWRFGDGSSERVTAARVAHTYGRAGSMAVSVILTWTADYAVGGGGFRPIGGTTTTTSAVRLLPVQEAETVASG